MARKDAHAPLPQGSMSAEPQQADSRTTTDPAVIAAMKDPADRANAKINMFGPLVWQMWKLNKEEYLSWVHDPFLFDGSQNNGQKDAQLFEWSVLEPLTKTVWWMIPLVWLPVSAYFWSGYVFSATFSFVGAFLCFAVGMTVWTLLEYAVHRWAFHLDDAIPDNGVSILLHFLLHGIHHKVPMDRYRLVMPPILFAALAVTGYNLFSFMFVKSGIIWSLPVYHAIFGSALIGYVCYDLVHYSQHHVNFASLSTKLKQKQLPVAGPVLGEAASYLNGMKKYHMRHHFNGQQGVGFGITNKLWDVVFGTLLDVNARYVPPSMKEGGDGSAAAAKSIGGGRCEAEIMKAIGGKDA